MTEPSDPSSASDVGRLVGDRYRLAEVIGVGGMATVHRATDIRVDRTVAVKLLRREVIADTDIAMRFRREALAETVLRHPNIVACLETGTDDGQPFLVMELIEGEDLAARLKRVGRLPPAEVERIGLDVARALGVAHIRGIVHRDVKPGNIVLARDGRAMVTDFGIARLAMDAEGAPGTTLGSVHYFSPEQAKGETTTAASDVYGVGLVLYEALTGQRAWSGDTTASLAAARIDAPAPSPRAVRPEVPAALDAIVVKALDPDPARRYPNGNALAEALEPLVGFPDPSSPTVGIATSTLAAAAPAWAAADGGAALEPASPMRPPAPAKPRGASLRRASPTVAGPLLVLLTVATVVAGALVVASLPGGGENTAVARASQTPRPERTPRPTPKPTATAKATPKPTPRPTPTPVPTPTPKPTPHEGAADICEPFLDLACGLGAGTYEPARFEPPIGFDLGDGWSTSVSDDHLVALGRDEGFLTLASGPTIVFKDGQETDAPGSVRGLVDAFQATRGVTGGRTATGRIDKHRATVLELKPEGTERVALFGTGTQTFFLEPFGTTRVFVVDIKGVPLLIVVEPAEGSALRDVLVAADPVVNSVYFR